MQLGEVSDSESVSGGRMGGGNSGAEVCGRADVRVAARCAKPMENEHGSTIAAVGIKWSGRERRDAVVLAASVSASQAHSTNVACATKRNFSFQTFLRR